jgi:ParB family chromosome partitioning protein
VARAKLADVLDNRAAERATVLPDEKGEADIAYDFMFGLGERPSGMAADIDTGTTAGGIRTLPIDSLVPYSNHPFKPYAEDKLNALAQSIRENGLQQPVIVRRYNDQYEILAGHNRAAAFRLNGETRIPAIIVDADDNQAAMIVTETNLRQREKLLPSEKAFAYRLQLDAIKHQGKKLCAEAENENGADTTVSCVQFEHKLKSRDCVAANNGVDSNDVRRHIRLTYLLPELLQFVDDRKLALIAGVDLSYLTIQQQHVVHQEFFINHAAHIDIKLTGYICEWTKVGKPLDTPEDMRKLLQKYNADKARSVKSNITFKRKTFEPYLSRIPKDVDLEKLFAEFLRERFGSDVAVRETKAVGRNKMAAS